MMIRYGDTATYQVFRLVKYPFRVIMECERLPKWMRLWALRQCYRVMISEYQLMIWGLAI